MISIKAIIIGVILLSSVSFGELPCETNAWPPIEENRIKEVTINLDLPPEDRWTDIMLQHKEIILNLFTTMKQHFESTLHLGQTFFTKFESFLKRKLHSSLQKEYVSEVVGIAKALEIDESYVTMLNVIFDFIALCTSAIQYDEKIGDVLHVRNLDFGLMFGFDEASSVQVIRKSLHPLLVSANFVSKGKTIFRSVTFAGSVGCLTGMRPGAFAISINARYALDGGFVGLLDLLYRNEINQYFTSLTVRDVLQNVSYNFEDAVQYLSNVPIVAPVYYAMSGTKPSEACVLARGRKKLVDRWNMDTSSNHLVDQLLIQANYDRKHVQPVSDDRITPVYRCVERSPKNFSSLIKLYNAFSMYPTADCLTMYTTIMGAGTNLFIAYKRNFTS